MKIRILESISCAVNGSFAAGEIVDWSDKKDAERLIKAGAAEAVKATRKKSTKVETASETKEVETATE